MARPLRIEKAGGWYHVIARGTARTSMNVSYSVWFNRRHGRSGHLFQGRFKSVAVSRDEWALAFEPLLASEPGSDRRLSRSKGASGLNFGMSMATRGGTWRCIWGGDCAG
jgi:hypothetical protein